MSIEILDFITVSEFGIFANLTKARVKDRYLVRLFYSSRSDSISKILNDKGIISVGGYYKIEFDSFDEMEERLKTPITEIPDKEWIETDAGFGYGISDREFNQAIRDRY